MNGESSSAEPGPSPVIALHPIIRVVALVESETHVCCRYRVAAFRSTLASAGYALEIRPLPRSLWDRVKLYRSLRSADVVVIQRRLLPVFELALVRRWARHLVFDFDDAVWLRDSYSRKGFTSRKRLRRFQAMTRTADLTIAGNAYLATEAVRNTHPDRVLVIPTCVDPTRYPVAKHNASDGSVRLVWVGSSSTLQGLQRFQPTLEAIGQSVPNVRLKLICDQFLKLDHLQVDAVPWSEMTEAAEIATADIGIGWVPDDPWSRGKCGLKILQYQAAGLPVITNPVGVHSEFVRDGVTGYQAVTDQEWIAAVRRLAANSDLRRTQGAAGRLQVEELYSVTSGGRMWVEQFDRMVRTGNGQGDPNQIVARSVSDGAAGVLSSQSRAVG